MYYGSAILCKFIENPYLYTDIFPTIINVLNYNSTYNSGEKLKFNATANDKVFDGLNTAIKISKKGELVKIAYGLTGDGWIVDLEPGEYTAVLSLTDYPDEEPSATTINVLEGTTIYIAPISNVKVGQEITINYTTNSNGTVTIKVNGQKINGTKFTPTKEGSYNVTVEVAENDYYKAASNQITFIVEKTAAVVALSPITNVVVGQEVAISYATNSNGTVTIKVNGQKINGTKFTPNSKGSHIVTVEVAENDYYKAASNETTFIVEKTIAAVVIIPITNVVVGQEVTINYNTNSNGTVTIKVNGQPKDSKFIPTKEGIYNVTVEVAENDYYEAASNQTTLKVVGCVFKENKNLSPLYSAKAVYKVLVICDGKAVGAGETVTIKFNGRTYSVKTDSKGYATLNLNTKVKPKTYTITAEYYGVKVSNKVTVKNIINAKNNKVKRSKKVNNVKVSLKKVNGKYIKGKVLKIKFNKKTYKVKTNKKGTATWKVKKSMLKKLKIGKTYKYQVAYGKDVVTKKLSIKK
jgi:hypothetical protein